MFDSSSFKTDMDFIQYMLFMEEEERLYKERQQQYAAETVNDENATAGELSGEEEGF